jgi:hypothetical protein
VPRHRSLEESLHVDGVDGDGFRIDELGVLPLLLVEAAASHVEKQGGRQCCQLPALLLRGPVKGVRIEQHQCCLVLALGLFETLSFEKGVSFVFKGLGLLNNVIEL